LTKHRLFLKKFPQKAIIDIHAFFGIVTGMNRKKILSAFCLLGIAILACTYPIKSEGTPIPVKFEPTPTLFVPPTPTSTPPLPAPIPTPIPAVRIENADQAFFNGDWAVALAAYQTELESNPDPETQIAAWLGIGRTRYQTGAYPEALTALRQIIEHYPETPQSGLAYFVLAQTYDALLRFSDAAEAYAQYLSLRPGVIDSYIQEWRGDALVAAGNHVAAQANDDPRIVRVHGVFEAKQDDFFDKGFDPRLGDF